MRRLAIFADMAQSWSLCFGPGTRLERFSYRAVSKVDKGHLAQHRCHCAASLHGQTSPATHQPGQALWVWQMGLCLQPCHQGAGVKVPADPREVPWTLFCQLLASGQQPRGGAGGTASTWGRMPLHLANPPAAKLVWELPPSPCHHPHASLPAQEGYHTFPRCQFSCLPNHRQAGCRITRGV